MDMIIRKKNGFTLIEILLVLALLVLVFSSAFSMQFFSNKALNSTSSNAEKQFAIRMPMDFIAKSIRFADSVMIKSSLPVSPTAGTSRFYVDESGNLVYVEKGTTKAILGSDGKADYTLQVTKKSGVANVITITLGKQGTTRFDITTDVEIVNLRTGSITGDASGKYMEFSTTQADSVTPVTITSLVNPPTALVAMGNAVPMPIRVAANMSDGTQRQVAVHWTPSTIDTSSAGYKEATGQVVGYSGTVSFHAMVGTYIIDSIPDPSITVYQNSTFSLPLTVSANLLDGSTPFIAEVPVVWTPTSISTSTPGTFTADGTVVGYSGTITFTLEVDALTITNIPNLAQTVNQGVSFTLPAEVQAQLDGGTKLNVPIVWTPSSLSTSTSGTLTSQGTVFGYAHPVTFTLTVVQTKLPSPTATVVTSGNNGTIKVYGTAGATAVVRKTNGDTVGTGIIAANGEVMVNNVNTNNAKDVILQKSGWLDSDPYLF